MKKLAFLVLLVLALGFLPVAGQATMYSTLASWEAAVASWAPVNLASQLAEFAVLLTGNPLNLPQGGTVSFTSDLYAYQVGSSWATWSGGNTPRVLTNFTPSVSGTFSAGQTAFGLEMEPDDFAVHSMTMNLGGANVLTQSVNGNGGALFFGYVGAPATTMTLSSDIDFAFGRMVQGTAAVPVPASVLLMGSGLLGLVILRRRFGR